MSGVFTQSVVQDDLLEYKTIHQLETCFANFRRIDESITGS